MLTTKEFLDAIDVKLVEIRKEFELIGISPTELEILFAGFGCVATVVGMLGRVDEASSAMYSALVDRIKELKAQE